MADLDRAVATQLANIEKRTGKSIEELSNIVRTSGLSRHGELVAMLKGSLGMGHGDANLLVHFTRKDSQQGPASEQARTLDEVMGELYEGPRAALRPIHERLLVALDGWGEFEWVPKKSYISYRRQKQFATIGPASKTSVELGLNMKGSPATGRLQALGAGRMCTHRVRLTDAQDVDAELLAWVRTAYEAAQ